MEVAGSALIFAAVGVPAASVFTNDFLADLGVFSGVEVCDDSEGFLNRPAGFLILAGFTRGVDFGSGSESTMWMSYKFSDEY